MSTFLKDYSIFKLLTNIKTIDAFVDATTHPNSIDDSKGVFQDGLQILSSLPTNSHLANDLSNKTISTLYNTVPHPPASLLGPQHNFRQADGAGNSLQDNDCGRAQRPYARSVQSMHPISRSALPDPGLVFDTLLKANNSSPKVHPGGNASFTFAFASIVTHSLFRTNHNDWNQNDTSSYLDLSPLYGHNQELQDSVRDKEHGRGLLYPDTFAEERLLFLPPAPCALLVIFNRNHNYIAERLLKINECKQWTDPPPTDPKDRALQDEQIFQTARLVNCGHFMSLILGDYAAGFLGLSEGTFWDIKAFDPIKLSNGEPLPRGQGNHVSVEFNMMYRWHATLSGPDIRWTEDMFKQAFGNTPFDELTTADFPRAMRYMAQHVAARPNERVFGGLQRDPRTHKFPDDGIAHLLQDATFHAGSAYGARATPGVLRVIEILGIEQARSWGVCTMNEFRRFLGLRKYESFLEWNHDKAVAAAAERLYGHIDNLELYAGLQAEQTMPVTQTSRLACGFSTTRAVLGDAIAMIRGDRYYTTDFTPANLTAWGYQDCARDHYNGGFGGEMPKLLMRHLPRHYPYNNVYSLFPFFTPRHMATSLTRQGLAGAYEFRRPVWAREPVVVNTLAGIRSVFGQQGGGAFASVYGVSVGGGVGRVDGERALRLGEVLPAAEVDKHVAWFRERVRGVIEEREWRYDGVKGVYVDVVGVVNALMVRWAAEFLIGVPLKTKENPKARFSDTEVYEMFQTLYQLVYLSIDDPEHRFSLVHAAGEAAGALRPLVAQAVAEAVPDPSSLGVLRRLFAFAWPGAGRACHAFVRRLAGPGTPAPEVVAEALGYAVAAVVSYAQAAVLVVDFYLDERRERECVELRRAVAQDDEAGEQLVRGYVREGMRLSPQCVGMYRDVVDTATVTREGGLPPVVVGKGDRVWASFRNAHLNPEDFADPEVIDPTRPAAAYRFAWTDADTGAGGALAEGAVAAVVRGVFGLGGVRRCAGEGGRLGGYVDVRNETERRVFVGRDGRGVAGPAGMCVVYDG